MLITPMLQRLRAARDLRSALHVALADMVALHGAERGNIQLVDPSGDLVIVEHAGLSAEFLRVFERVTPGEGSVCARAAQRQELVFVPDVQVDPAFAPFRAIARAVPFRAVLSSPLATTQGECVGIASLHFANPFTPSALELDSLRAYCRAFADIVAAWHPGAALRERALELAARVTA